MYSLISKYQAGGLIDTDAMMADVKKDPTFFKDGAYTNAGRKRLTAIVQIQENQDSGLRYNIDDKTQTFEITDKAGERVVDSEGRGIGTGERHGALYGTINRYKKSKKEISKAISTASNYFIQPQARLKSKVETSTKGVETSKKPVDTPTKPEEKTVTTTTTTTTSTSDRSIQPVDFGSKNHISLGKPGAQGPGGAYAARSGVGVGGDGIDPNTGEVAQPFDQTLSEDRKGWLDNLNYHTSAIMGVNYNPSAGNVGGWENYSRAEATVNEKVGELRSILTARQNNDNLTDEQLNRAISVPVVDDPELLKEMGASGYKNVLVKDATDEQLLKAIDAKKGKYTSAYFDQAFRNADELNDYLRTERKRLEKQVFENESDRKAMIAEVDRRIGALTEKLSAVENNPNMETFTSFYGENLPNSSEFIYDYQDHKLYNKEEYQNIAESRREKATAAQMSGWQKKLTNQLIYGTAGFNHNSNMSSATLTNGSKVDLYKIREAVENATTPQELQNIWIPIHDPETGNSNGSGKRYKMITAYDFVNGNMSAAKHVNVNTFTGDMKKFVWKYRVPRKENGGLITTPPSNRLIPKAQVGLNTAYLEAIQQYLAAQKRGEVVGAPAGTDYTWNTNDTQSIVNPNQVQTYQVSTAKGTPQEKMGLIQAPSVALPTGTTGDYASTSNLGVVTPTEAKIAERNAADAARVGAQENVAGTGVGATGVNTPVNRSGGDQDILNLNENDFYLQRGDDPRAGGGIGGNIGPIISRTGINTPIGEVQFNDIAQFILAKKAKDDKIADIPVFQKTWQDRSTRHVLAPRDIDAEMRNSMEKGIAGMSSGYAGSDPVAGMVATMVTNQAKEAASRELKATRADYRRADQDRVADQMWENQQIRDANAQGQHAVDEENRFTRYQGDLQAAAEEKRRKDEWRANLGSLGAGIQSRWNAEAAADKQFRTGLAVQQYQKDLATKQGEKQRALDNYTNYKYGGAATEEGLAEYKRLYDEADQALLDFQKSDIKDVLREADKINYGRSINRWWPRS